MPYGRQNSLELNSLNSDFGHKDRLIKPKYLIFYVLVTILAVIYNVNFIFLPIELMKNHYAIIMAGGVGTRFWPMSTSAHPKQFLDILGTGRTLLQQTYDRLLRVCPNENIFIVTSASYEDLCATQLPKLPKQNILCEPSRKNTAPCVAYASYKIHKINPKAITIVAPSDHLITKEDTFVKAINSCFAKPRKKIVW